jgi:hypothetical protein
MPDYPADQRYRNALAAVPRRIDAGTELALMPMSD